MIGRIVFSVFAILLIAGSSLDIYINNRIRKGGEMLVVDDAEMLTGVTSFATAGSNGISSSELFSFDRAVPEISYTHVMLH